MLFYLVLVLYVGLTALSSIIHEVLFMVFMGMNSRQEILMATIILNFQEFNFVVIVRSTIFSRKREFHRYITGMQPQNLKNGNNHTC